MGPDEIALEARRRQAMAAGLRKLLEPKATWRTDKQPESMRAIMAALKTNPTVISVLPTGSGKSILFVRPSIMQNTRTSIVVVPFVALMEDLITRAVAMGIDCLRFRSSLHVVREGLPSRR